MNCLSRPIHVGDHFTSLYRGVCTLPNSVRLAGAKLCLLNRPANHKFDRFAVIGIVIVLSVMDSLSAKVSHHVSFRRTNWPDRGSVHIYLSNDGEKQVRLSEIVVNDRLSFNVTESGFVASAELDEIMEDMSGIPPLGKRVPLILRDYLPQNAKPGDVLWYFAPAYNLAPGEISELVIKFSNSPKKPIRIRLCWSDQRVTEVAVDPTPAELWMSAITFEPTYDKLYAYVRNNNATPTKIAHVWVNGKQQAEDSVVFVNRTVPPGGTGMAAVSPRNQLLKGQWVYVLIETADGHGMFGSARALTGFPVYGRGGIIEVAPAGLSYDGVKLKGFGSIEAQRLDLAAERVIRNRCNPGYYAANEYFTFWASQGFIKWGATGLGELTDAARVHFQPSEVQYLGHYNNSDWHYVQAKARYLQQCFAPRPVFGQTVLGHAIMGAGWTSLLAPEEFRLRIYYMVSRAIKGVEYRGAGEQLLLKSTLQERQALATEIGTVNQELMSLRPYLRVADHVEGVAWTSEPLVECATLLAGDKGMVLVLLNHDRQQSWPQNEMFLKNTFFLEPVRSCFTVSVQLPEGLKVVRIVELRGNRRVSIPFRWTGSHIEFDVPSLYATRQYILLPDRKYSRRAPQSPEYPVRKRDGPRAVFLNKQQFLGTLSPSEEPCKAVFVCRNDGNELLKLEYMPQGDRGLSVSPERATVEPQERVSLTVLCTRESAGLLHKIVHFRTTDLDRPSVRLDIGADVRPQMNVSPTELALSKDKKPVGKILVSDNSNKRELKVLRVSSPERRLKIEMKERRQLLVSCPNDVYHKNEVRHYYEITIEPKFEEIEKRVETRVLIETNSGDLGFKSVIIPVAIDVSEDVIAISPPSLLFYTRGRSAIRTIHLTANGRAFDVISATAKHENVTLSVRKSNDKEEYEIVATWNRTEGKGIFKGEINITVVHRGRESVIIVPYSAVVR